MEHNTKVPNLSRKVPDFWLIPSYFFHASPHFLDTALQTCPHRAPWRTKKRRESPHLSIATARNPEKGEKMPLMLAKKGTAYTLKWVLPCLAKAFNFAS